MELSDIRENYWEFDFSKPRDIETYGKELVGHTFNEILSLGIEPGEGVADKDYGDASYKGGLGTLIEEHAYGYPANNDDRPDFFEAGIELKTTCYDVLKNGDISAGERLVLTMIPYDREITDDLYQSHCWSKSNSIMLIFYERDRTKNKYDQVIKYATLFSFPEEDLKIIEDDYKTISTLVRQGRADELSESLTMYLGACTKGSTAEKSWVPQFYAPDRKAKKRAFSLKRSYMDYILHEYVMKGKETYVHEDQTEHKQVAGRGQAILKDASNLNEQTFEEYVESVINTHVGKTDKELCREFGVEYTGNKAQWTTLVYEMLGVHGDQAEEFVKAGINVRVVREEANGQRIKESMSLNPFDFIQVAEETWEESWLKSHFDETRFFFVVFQKGDDGARLKGCSFWNMPEKDKEWLYRCWEDTQQTIRKGVELKVEESPSGKVRVTNNLPKAKDNPVAHVRPHASKSAYLFADGTVIGDIKKDAKELPDGRYMTTQSFWLNSSYLQQILKSEGL